MLEFLFNKAAGFQTPTQVFFVYIAELLRKDFFIASSLYMLEIRCEKSTKPYWQDFELFALYFSSQYLQYIFRIHILKSIIFYSFMRSLVVSNLRFDSGHLLYVEVNSM